MCLAGAGALRIVQPRIGRSGTVRHGYLAACAVATAGIAGLALAPDAGSAGLAVLLAAGALPLTRSFVTIWVNSHTFGAVRATVHSLLAQTDYAGTIVCGLAVALVADVSGMLAALAICAALLVTAVIVVLALSGGRDRQ